MEISKEKYPYEIYRAECGHPVAYIDHIPEDGDQILTKGVINIDGSFPVPGEAIQCLEGHSGFGQMSTWKVRPRPTTIWSFPGEAVDRHLKLYGHLPALGCCEHDQPKSKCCNARMVGGVQCENCGSNGK